MTEYSQLSSDIVKLQTLVERLIKDNEVEAKAKSRNDDRINNKMDELSILVNTLRFTFEAIEGRVLSAEIASREMVDRVSFLEKAHTKFVTIITWSAGVLTALGAFFKVVLPYVLKV